MDLSNDLEKIELQETELVLPKFDFDVAWQIGSLVRNLGLTRGSPIVVDVGSFGQPWATAARFFKAFGKRASFGFYPAHAGRCRQIVQVAEQQVQPFVEDVRDRTLPCLQRVLSKTP